MSEELFEAVFREWFAAIRGYLYRRTSDWCLSEDLAAQTFLHAWLRREQYSEVGQLKSWLFTIARRVLIDYRRGDRLIVEPLSTLHEPACSRSAIEFSAIEDDEWIAEMCRNLQPQQRDTVLLSQDGYSGEDIAAQLGLTHGNVRILKMRGLRKLRARVLQSASIDG